jgi:hypothetical protein
MHELVQEKSNVNSAVISGVLAGTAGLLVFLIIHHLWILPIWFILPIGLGIAVAGGAATGWAYRLLLPNLPRRPWRSLALMALIWAVLLPGIVLAEVREPFFVLSAGDNAVLTATIGRVALGFILELLLTAVIVAALAGWLIGRSRQAAMATAVAGLIFALGPGHNIPLIGGTGGTGKELAIMAAVILVSAVVLVSGEARLRKVDGEFFRRSVR